MAESIGIMQESTLRALSIHLGRSLDWLRPDRWNITVLVLFWVLAPWIYDGGMGWPLEVILRPTIFPYYSSVVVWDVLETYQPAWMSSGLYWLFGRSLWPYLAATLLALPLKLVWRKAAG